MDAADDRRETLHMSGGPKEACSSAHACGGSVTSLGHLRGSVSPLMHLGDLGFWRHTAGAGRFHTETFVLNSLPTRSVGGRTPVRKTPMPSLAQIPVAGWPG